MDIVSQNETPHQEFNVPVVEKDHKVAIIIGYILAVLIPIFGVFVSVYLLTRDDSANAKKHGKYILIVSVIVWIISFITTFSMY